MNAKYIVDGTESRNNPDGSKCISHALITLELFEHDNVRYISMSDGFDTMIVPLDNITHDLKKLLRR